MMRRAAEGEWRGAVLGMVMAMAAALGCWVSPAWGVQAPVGDPADTLIAELVGYEDVRLVVPAGMLDAFMRTVGPTAEQREAAGVLIGGARTELSRVINRHLRAVRDDPTLAEINASEAEVVRQAARVERGILGDLRSLLMPEQEGRFVAFLRAHRRTLLPQVSQQPLPVDLGAFFQTSGFDPGGDPTLVALLERFDREGDAALVRERRALKAYFASVRLGFDGSTEARERDRQAQIELRRASAGLERVQAAVIGPLLAALPAEVADRLVMEIMARVSDGFDRTAANPERYPVTREVMALPLTDPQRARATELIRQAKADALEMARTCVKERARVALLEPEAQAKVDPTPVNRYWGEASKLRVRLSKDLLGLLTAEQRAAYDASEVVEPADVSKVKQE